jgi:hypothetical protein
MYFFCFCRAGVAPGRVELALDQVTSKLDSILVAFDLEEVTLAMEMSARMEAARGRLKSFVKRVATDVVQFSMALVKFHLPEEDLDPVKEGVAPDCTDEECTTHFESTKPLADHFMTQIDL